MSFFTSLTGLNAATTELAVTSNNIANAGTTGFKRSRAEFGDIFSSSPLQKASSIVGQGTLLKGITQEFSQGNIEFSENTLDLAISGQGFFALKPDLTSVQTVYTRNGSFSLNNDRYVVDSSGQYLRAFPVNDDGSVIATTLDAATELRIPEISGLPRASSEITLGLNLPADAEVIPARDIYRTGQAVYAFNPDDSDTFNTSTSITVFDSLGNPSIATIYYVKTQNASVANPTNKWQTHIYVGGREIDPALISVKNDREEPLYVNEFGELTSDPQSLDPGFIPDSPHPKYVLDDQPSKNPSQPERVQTPIIPNAYTFGSTGDISRGVGTLDDLGNLTANALASQNLFRISVDGSSFQTISLSETGNFNGVELAEALTREVNRAFSDERTFRLEDGTSNVFRVAAFSRDQQENTFEILAGAVSPRGSVATDARSLDVSSLDVVANEQYSIQIGAKRFTVTPTAAELAGLDENGRRDFVAAELAAAIDADASFAASSSVGDDGAVGIRISNGAGLAAVLVDSSRNQPDLQIELPTTRTELSVPSLTDLNLDEGQGVSINGAMIEVEENSPNALVERINAVTTLAHPLADIDEAGADAAQARNIDLSGVEVIAGEEYSLFVDGTRYTYRAAVGDDLEAVANDLLGQLTAAEGGAGSFSSGTLTLDDTVGVGDAALDFESSFLGTGIRADREGDTIILRAVQGAAVAEVNEDGDYIRDADGRLSFQVVGFNRTLEIGNVKDGAGAALSENALGVPTGSSSSVLFGPEEINYTPETLVENAQEQINSAGLALDVSYDLASRSLSFKPREGADGLAIQQLLVRGGSDVNPVANELLGFKADGLAQNVGPDLRDPEFRGGELVPNGPPINPSSQQRFGIQVNYLRESQRFEFSSGTTGVESRIVIEPVLDEDDNVVNEFAAEVFGLNSLSVLEGEGLSAQPAVTVSGQPGRDISGAFFVTEQDNRVSVSIDGISGVVRVPPASYTGETFAQALESRINLIQDGDGRRVSGVRVEFDVANERFRFTSGTTGENSFVSINGHPNWGLSETTATRGQVPTYLNLVQDTDELGRLIFIDRDGNETVEAVGSAGQEWFPVYLRKGELTFDTQGRLISPKEGAQYEPFDPLNGADPIVLNVDYGRNSTQFNAPFSLLSLSQDGFPSGRLDGLEVDASGVVRATYTNGQQLALGKVILANFPNPNGLKQIGDANFLTTATSGAAALGQAGSEGYGSIQSGARERANVDLTNELVDLITAQRNFQANAKAIETSTSLTQTIINIRS